MMELADEVPPLMTTNMCEWCGGVGTSRCGRCHSVYYCSREHQTLHWTIHKKVCQNAPPPETLAPVKTNLQPLEPMYQIWNRSTIIPDNPRDLNQVIIPRTVTDNTAVYLNQVITPQAVANNTAIDLNQVITPQNVADNTAANPNQVIIPHAESGNTAADLNQMIISQAVSAYGDGDCSVVGPQKVLDYYMNDEAMFSSLSSELLSSDNNFWELINPCDTQNISDFMYLDKDIPSQPQTELAQTSPQYSSQPQISDALGSTLTDPSSTATKEVEMECAPLHDICATVIHDMNEFGICVLDNFIGSNYGNLLFEEVKNLYLSGIFKKGEVVNPNPYKSKDNVRCDVTTWVDGTEPNCRHIGNLVRKLDVVLTTCNKMPNNGQFSNYKLHRRTKAMIACYPGDGTYYKKHIDNPHRDGRCITCIYYLNQNWDTKTHGGLLRMFPSSDDSQVANIEPIFDRMLFFWSDKRNPHEVLPSYATRFAITVWYFDADERDRALRLCRKKASMNRHHVPVR